MLVAKEFHQQKVFMEDARLGEVSEEIAVQGLKKINLDSATGPDLFPARILKECASELGKPFSRLVQRIFDTGNWPDSWRAHWIVPRFDQKGMVPRTTRVILLQNPWSYNSWLLRYIWSWFDGLG